LASANDYRQVGHDLLARAHQLENRPELRAIYIRLAASYEELARFHERSSVGAETTKLLAVRPDT